MKVKVTYEELLTRSIEIDVLPTDDIYQRARELYQQEQITLTGNDLQVTSFMIETPTQIGDWETI